MQQQPPSSSSSSSSLLQQINKQAYLIIRDKFPLLAGAAVGNKKQKVRSSLQPLVLSTDPSSIGTKPVPRSSPAGGATNIQVIDIKQGTVDNIVKFKGPRILGSPKCEITVSGKAWVTSPTRLSVAFESFVLKIGRGGLEKVRVPLTWLGPPTGEVETIYLDESVRISVGDKGGLYIATVKKN